MATIGKIPGSGGVKGAGAPSDPRRASQHGHRPSAQRDPVIHEPSAEARGKAAERSSEKAPVNAATLADAPTLTDRALGAAGLATTAANIVAMPVFMGSQLAGKVVTEQAELSKLGFFGRQRNRLAKFMGKVTEPTFEDIGKKLGVNKALGAVAQPVANVTGDIAQNNFKGIFGRLREKRLGKAAGNHAVLKDQISRLQISELHSELAPHVREMHSALHVSDTGKFDAARFGAAKEAFDTTAKQLAEGPAGKEIIGTVKSVNRIAGRAEKMVAGSTAASRYENIGQTIKAAPGAIAKTSAVHGVMNAGFIGASVVSMANDLRGFTKQLAALKRMMGEMTGRDPAKISTMEALLGNAPAPVRAARSHMLKFTAISEAADSVGLLVNAKSMIGKGFTNPIMGMMAFMIPQKISEGAGNMLGPNVLQAYDAISRAQKAGQQIGAGDYTQLLYLASPELKAKGDNNAFLAAIAEQFAQSQTSAADVLKAATNGDITARISQLIVKNEEARKAANVAEEATPSVSHAERLAGAKKEHPLIGKAAVADKTAQGKFSQQVIARETGAENAPTAGR